MSGSTEDETTLKGGHAPAIKVGGKRVAPHKSSNDKTEPMTEDDIKEFGSPPKVDTHHQNVLISGALMKGDQEFSSQALKFHEKPVATHEKRRQLPTHMYNIHQPGKK